MFIPWPAGIKLFSCKLGQHPNGDDQNNLYTEIVRCMFSYIYMSLKFIKWLCYWSTFFKDFDFRSELVLGYLKEGKWLVF